MKTMSIKFVFSCSRFFLQTGKFWRENFPVALKTNKRDSATFCPGLIKNEPLMTWLNLFLDDFNQKSRRINKKNTKSLAKRSFKHLLMQIRSRNGSVHYGRMTAGQSVSANQNAPFHRK